MIKTAEELHTYLLTQKNFDFKPDHERDFGLYHAIKAKLELPDGEFLTALRTTEISAEQYFRALLEAAQPLSKMYIAIFEYCKQAKFLKSKGGAQIEWEISDDGKNIAFSLEAFRHYENYERTMLLASAERLEVKNKLMNWLRYDVFANHQPRLVNNLWDWTGIPLFKILYDARNPAASDYHRLFGGLNNIYLDGTRSQPCPTDLMHMVSNHHEYPTMLKEVQAAFAGKTIEAIASEFIELPFWKYRWQIYELWTITVALKELSRCGYVLKISGDGHALTELGTRAVLAAHPVSGWILAYQPTYTNRDGNVMHPDLTVATSDDINEETGLLILECKQRLSLDAAHIAEVAQKYRAGVNAQDGELAIVNYDAVDNTAAGGTAATVIADVRPGAAGEDKLIRFLQQSRAVRRHIDTSCYVDLSQSMSQHVTQSLKDCLHQKQLSTKGGSFELYGFALSVDPMRAEQLEANIGLSLDPDDEQYQGKGLVALRSHIAARMAANPARRIIIISDADPMDDSEKLAAPPGMPGWTVIDPREVKLSDWISQNHD